MSRKTTIKIEGVTNFDIPHVLFTTREEIENQFGDQYPQMENMTYSYSLSEDGDTATHTYSQVDGTKNS